MKNEKLNVFSMIISEKILIEASAGTGKTYNIVLIYIRLILGIHPKKNYMEPYSVKNILLITYTNKALEEIKKRIIDIIEKLKKSCINKKNRIKEINIIFKKISNFDKSIKLLEKAELEMHEASIYTIHKFCFQVINSNNFLWNNIYQSTILNEETKIYYQSLLYFWKNIYSSLPSEIISIIYEYWKNPDKLLIEIKKWIKIYFKYIKKKSISKKHILDFHKKNILKINNFKKFWIQKKEIIFFLLNKIKKINTKFPIKKYSMYIQKICIWCKTDTKNYFFPKEINFIQNIFLKKKTEIFKKKNNLKIFNKINIFLKKNISLKEIFLFYAMVKIQKNIEKEKNTFSKLEFDDLIDILYEGIVIKKNILLINFIREKYPIALIDECQDINFQQYKFFQKIYEKKNTALILIGDPKQSIFSFTGANVFSYIKYKQKINKKYFLETNWRSSKKIIENINNIFNYNNNPFIFPEIKYKNIKYSKKNKKYSFQINKILQPAFNIYYFDLKNQINLADYYKWSSKKCSQGILKLVNSIENKTSTIYIKNKKKNLSFQDIAILVRNYNEAKIIKQYLKKEKISSYYSSNKNNIFSTSECLEILWFLQAILYKKEKYIIRAFNTILLGCEKNNIYNFYENKKNKIYIMEKIEKFLILWKNKGIYNLIKKVTVSNIITKKKLYDEQIIINYLHIGEILQKKYNNKYNKFFIINWIKKQINYSYLCENKNFHIRTIQSKKSIQIITIHKSKGLEYPIVWIPFIINFQKNNTKIHFSRKNFNPIFNLYNTKNKTKWIKEESLSEEIRIIYVALTRSILQCNFTVAPIKKKYDSSKNTDIHKTGLGYILQNKKKINSKKLKILFKLKFKNKLNNNILYESKEEKNKENKLITYTKKNKNIKIYKKNKLKNKFFTKKIISYSQLTYNSFNNNYIIKNNEKQKNKLVKTENTIESYIFEKGKNFGLFIHEILKIYNFSECIKQKKIFYIINKFNFPINNIDVLYKWINNIINTQLYPTKIKLSKILLNNFQKEFEFYIPIKKILYAKNLNIFLQEKNKKNISKLYFDPISGILHGFIDLIIKIKNKYFIIEYKSDWLGEEYKNYNINNMQKSIFLNKYDLQCNIYILGLHRYLQQRIKTYNFKKNFGGFFYLFLRGLHPNYKKTGIFFISSDSINIQKLNKLF
ncbi:exodeoxyribonuclease V subunit beta [Buchnera aphidicola (Kurisakia onigurumii)]|uniref:exodeoxyribonuclease V subunit beta n=1 Tax=Buchnera aphidicola TaxID=9 RepID=UPI0031B6BCB2